MHLPNLAELFVQYLVFVFSTTCHEAAHAYLALKGGDPTAYLGGHVTLDPTPHIRRSPFGMVVVPLLGGLFGGFVLGWASVPYDPNWARRHPRRAALMSLAGPGTNFLLALIAIGVLKVLYARGVFFGVEGKSPLAALHTFLDYLWQLNVALGVFNLIPLPPLDGAGVAEGAAPRTLGSLYDRLREQPMLGMVGLVLAWRIFPEIISPVMMAFYRLLQS